MPVFNNMLAGASGQGGAGYEIERSLRFNSADSAYLNRTPSSAGNRRTWTWSGWVKRSNTTESGEKLIFGAGTSGGTNLDSLSITAADQIRVFSYGGSYVWHKITTAVFRDPSAWYHIVYSVDTSNSTAEDRVKIYVNGVRLTTFSTSTNPTQNADAVHTNTTNAHYICKYIDAATYANSYIADVHFIDGQALAATDFGETDDNGVWQPKEFKGVYSSSEVNGATSPSVFYSEAPSYQTIANINSGTGPVGVNNVNGGYIRVKFHSAQTSVTTIGFEGGAYASGGTFEVLVNGISVANKTVASGWAADSVTISSTDITEIEFRSTDSGYALGQLTFNGTLVPGTPSLGTPASGTNSFHLPFTDNSSNAALGTDTSGNSNTWTVNNLSAAGSAWDQSQTWTSYITGPASSSYGIENLFDGNGTGLSYTNGTTATAGNTLTWQPSTPITGVNTLVLGTYGNIAFNVNGTSVSAPASLGLEVSIDKATYFSNGVLTNISWAYTDGSNYMYLTYIKVNGILLVNPGIFDPLSVNIDSLVDSPTNGTQTDSGAGGEVVANYPTWNPLASSSSTFSNGNLEVTTGASYPLNLTNFYTPAGTGKWYWEFELSVLSGNNYTMVGMLPADSDYQQGVSNVPKEKGGISIYVGSDGDVETASGAATLGTDTAIFAVGDILGWAFDAENGTLQCYKNGVSQGTQFTNIRTDIGWVFCVTDYDSSATATYVINFGQRAFAYAAPSGYKCLNTANLPDPTIEDGSQYFDTKLYTSNSSSLSVTGYKFSPSFVWIKNRSSAQMHGLFDVVRGANQFLSSNRTNAEHTTSGSGYGTGTFNSFDSNGFTLGDDIGQNSTNYPSGEAHVAWTWDAGSSNTTIAAGTSFNTQSQTWSTYGTFTGTFSSTYTWPNVFNDSMAYDGSGSMYNLTVAKWTLTSSISCNFGVKFYVYGNQNITINAGLSDAVTLESTGGNTFHYFTIPFSGNISNIQVNSTSNYLMRIYVDDGALVDTGITVTNGDPTQTTASPSIASTVRANPSAGFSIVSWTGNSTAGGTIGHGLNAEPGMIIVKNRDDNDFGVVYHNSVVATSDTGYYWLKLFAGTSGTESKDWNANSGLNMWNNTNPTSSVFTVGDSANVNQSTEDYIAYCFTPVEGYSAMGSFEANTDADGPFVYTGFKPRFLLIKNADDTTFASSYSWVMIDTERYPNNTAAGFLNPLYANRAAEENLYGPGANAAAALSLDILSNGFKPRCANAELNVGGTYIYYAVAEHPFKTARAR